MCSLSVVLIRGIFVDCEEWIRRRVANTLDIPEAKLKYSEPSIAPH
jgi:hypothetical protein